MYRMSKILFSKRCAQAQTHTHTHIHTHNTPHTTHTHTHTCGAPQGGRCCPCPWTFLAWAWAPKPAMRPGMPHAALLRTPRCTGGAAQPAIGESIRIYAVIRQK
eukprot:222147-Pelagomonas_calceolata.AAC.2